MIFRPILLQDVQRYLLFLYRPYFQFRGEVYAKRIFRFAQVDLILVYMRTWKVEVIAKSQKLKG